MNFWESRFLWQEAVVSSVFLAAACAVTGMYTVLRRVVFLPAALSAVSGFGVMLAFWIGALWLPQSETWLPYIASVALAVSGAWYLGRKKNYGDALIGIGYIGASALTMLIANHIPQESHHVSDILFGNAVMVDAGQMNLAVVVSLIVLMVHLVMGRRFMFVSFDRDTAVAHGLRVGATDALLFFSLALAVSIATRTIGALPAFVYTLLPPLTVMQLFYNSRHAMIAAAAMAMTIAFVGYYLSFVYELPTGATSATVAIVVTLGGLAAGRFHS